MQECACIIQSDGLGKQATKVAGQHAGNERCRSWFLVEGAAGSKKKLRGAMRGRESRQPNVSPASLPKVTSRVRHAASKGCGSAGRQQRVGLDLRDGELQVAAEYLRPCARRFGSRGVAAVVGRSNKGQLQEQSAM